MIGINIQSPFAELLINSDKCVETRTYPLPLKYEGEELALIETPGKIGKFKARIIGTITFSHSFKYDNLHEWISDYNRHRVEQESNFGWNEDKDTYGWVVSQIYKFDEPFPAPENKGIVFTNNCNTTVPTGV
jgi:hypothetical protein